MPKPTPRTAPETPPEMLSETAQSPPADSDLARFRAGEAYELVVFDRLGDDERTAFAELAGDPDFYGVLRPRAAAGGRHYRAVDRETALLLLTLAEPAPLPFFARGDGAAGGIAELVLDEVLEVEHHGAFVTGPAALPLLAANASSAGGTAGAGAGSAAGHPLCRLAGEALRYAAALGSDEPRRLAALLYDFNRLPATPGWEHRLADRGSVLAFLGYAAGSPQLAALRRGWEIGRPDDDGGWIHFTTRHGRERGATAAAASCKLYVSPPVEALPQAFAALVAVLGRRPGAAFKVGADAAGLLRPDKLVAYFADAESLLAVARELEARLDGVAAHGVPFTAPIDAAGLLSWGVDPPTSLRPLSWQGPESWRTWLAGRLAVALARARAAGEGEQEACRFALARVAREGVDVERWLPAADLFRAA